MKNKLKYLLFFLCLMFITSNVYAYDNNSVFNRDSISASTHNGIKYGSSESNAVVYLNSIYYVTNKTNTSEKYYAYCVDPSLSAYNTLGVDHVLMSEESNTKAEDYGLLNVLKNGMWQYNGNISTNEQKINYEATSMAVRMFVNGILGWNYRHTTKAIFPSYMGTLYNWINSDPQMKADYTALTGHDNIERIYKQFGYSSVTHRFYFVGTYGPQVETKAKSILKNALRAAVQYKNGEVNDAKVSITTAGGGEISETASDGNTRYERLLVTEISLQNFNLNADIPGYFNYLGYETITSNTTVTEIGYSFEYSENADDYSKNGLLSKTANLVEVLNSKKKEKIYIAYNVVFTTDDKDCNAKFNVKAKYYDKTLLNGAMLVPLSDTGKDYTDGQRFLIYSNAPIEVGIPMNAKMCDSACSPSIGLPQICQDGSTPDANGNVTYEYREGKENIKKCILENTDSAGNSLKLNDSKYAAAVSNNPYCSVYCKEDYSFTVPYKRTVTNGRYFRISMSIKGQQDCYSTKLDTSKFQSEVIAKQKEIVDSYNEYQMYYELLNNNLTDSGDDLVCRKRQCELDVPTYEELAEGENFSCKSSGSIVMKRIDQKEIKFTGTYYAANEVNGQLAVAVTTAPESVKFGKVTNNYGSCASYETDAFCNTINGYTCEFTTPEDDYEAKKVSEDYQGKMAAAKKRLESAVEALKQSIDLYNSCMGDSSYNGYSNKYSSAAWEMVYLFDPEITYRYDEPNPGVAGDKYMDSGDCVGAACDIMIPIVENIYSEKCSDEDLESGKCKEVNKVNTIFDNKSVATTEYCMAGDMNESTYKCSNPKSSITYDQKSYFMCNESGGVYACGPSTYKVTNMSYVHKVATAEGEYDTPRVYYSVSPYGQIKISSTTVPNGTLVDGLPVGANTPIGDYYYIISISGLGRYYDSQKTGRIFGTDSSSLTTAERLNRKETLNGEELRGNEYACTYKVSQSCTDENGVDHTVAECSPGQSWDECKKALCPNKGNYCVKEAESYYVCDNQYYDKETCTAMDSREAAINSSQENYNCCPNCQVFCVGHCIQEITEDGKADLKLEFRPISPSIINPNDRHLGYNWDINNSINTLMAQKAGNTISEIEERANVDIDNATDEEIKKIESYSMKVNLTPEMANWIRNYNDETEESGSYNNDTLKCYDYKMNGYTENNCKNAGYTWKEGTCVMPNVFCYSTFIDELEEKFTEDVDAPNRKEAKSTAHANYNVYANSNNLPHQGTQIVTNDYWTIYQYTNLDVNSDGIPDIGPSWK